jgi:hypothetical protein
MRAMTNPASNSSDEPESQEVPLDPAVTAKLFRQWRSPRFGRSNPECMNNPVWEWIIRTQLTAYGVNQRLNGPSSFDAGPGWCFQRFGQSSTPLPDGRVVMIGGEHEDNYDPDFYIYNDVVARHPDGRLEIFGYPKEVFPPTDFHSATLVERGIIIIGCLGYPEQRKPDITPVLRLDLDTFAIAPIATSGSPPGWIHEHTAALADDGASILIQGGKLDRGPKDSSLVENLDDWRLDLAARRWERLSERRWQRWEVRRQDRRLNHLWQFRSAFWMAKLPACKEVEEKIAELTEGLNLPSLEEELGVPPNLELFARLYRPDVAHEEIAQVEGEHGVHRIRVEGVVVRYVEAMHGIQMTIEGELPQATVDALASDLCAKMTSLENTRCKLRQL